MSMMLTLGLMVLIPTAAFAQQYKQDPAITDTKQIGSLRREVAGAIRSPSDMSDTAKKAIVRYYRGVVLNGMTNPSAWKNADQLPGWRREVVGDLETCRNARTAAYIRELIYRYAGKIIVNKDTPSYHPAAKYNALLLIGSLDERPARGAGSARKPAVPFRKARGLLLSYAKSAPSEELRVGAMIGLARHAKFLAAGGMSPNDEELAKIRNVFGKVVSEAEPPQGISADGHRWMQMIALEGLGDIGDPRAEKLVLGVMNNAEAPLVVRCAAADAIGRLRYSPQQKPDPKAVVSGLGTVALESLKKQIAYLQTLMNQELDTRNNSRGIGGEVEELAEITRVRRELKHQLTCVNDALEGLGNAVQSSAKTALSSQLDTLIKALDEENMDPKSLYDKLIQPGLAIETAIKSA